MVGKQESLKADYSRLTLVHLDSYYRQVKYIGQHRCEPVLLKVFKHFFQVHLAFHPLAAVGNEFSKTWLGYLQFKTTEHALLEWVCQSKEGMHGFQIP